MSFRTWFPKHYFGNTTNPFCGFVTHRTHRNVFSNLWPGYHAICICRVNKLQICVNVCTTWILRYIYMSTVQSYIPQTVRRYNAVSFLLHPKKRHQSSPVLGHDMGLFCGFGLYSVLVTAVMSTTSCYIAPRYNCTSMYVDTVSAALFVAAIVLGK